jgi:hypothetical protein
MFHLALIAIATKKYGSVKVRGVGRVLAYSAGLSLVIGAVGIHKARAEVGEQGLKFGEDMVSLAPMMQDVKTFHLNGQVVHTAATTSLEGVNAVLDKYEASCKSALGQDAPVWDSLPDTSKEPTSKQREAGMMLSTVPIIRQVNHDKGMIACFVPTKDSPTHTKRALGEALADFQKTGNFSAIGKFRYAYVKESATGSMIITVWSDGDFSVKALMPEPGQDAQGEDPTVMMRPEQGQRMFTGTVDALPYKVYAYRSKLAPAAAIQAYDDAMEKAGWMSVKNPVFEGMPHVGSEGRAYIHSDKGVAGVVSATLGPDGTTTIGIAEVTSGKIQTPIQGPKDSDGF